MVVIGIDFGNESCYVAAVKDGGVDILVNEDGQRMTPSFVSFGKKSRSFGVQAKSGHSTNIKNTICNFKRLFGGKMCDPFIKNEKTYLPYHVCDLQSGDNKYVGIKVQYRNENVVFSIQQIVAMLFAKLKETAEIESESKITACVLSVPSYFTNDARLALLDAAQIANLNVLKLMNDTTAAALWYGFYKQDVFQNKPQTVIFIDMGHTSLQISACHFSNGEMKVLATTTCTNVGGRDFDISMVRHFADEFKDKYSINILSNDKAIIRLMTECDKLKKQLSANPQSLPMNIDCLMEDQDVKGKLDRKELEKLCQELLFKVENTMRQVLVDANLSPNHINSVELVGGSCRIPAIKLLVQKVFKCEPSTTLNLDEAVAKGCALQCALLSPSLKVREFSILDVQMLPIKLTWPITERKEGVVEAFCEKHQFPFSKYLTFYQTKAFTLKAYYGLVHQKPNPLNQLGTYTVKEVKCSASGESVPVLVKVRIDINGIFTVISALEKKASSTTPIIDQKIENTNDIINKSEIKSGVPNKIVNNKEKELSIESMFPKLSTSDLNKLIEKELSMMSQDNLEKERISAKNNLEEYIYDLRCSLSGDLEPFVTQQESQNLLACLEEAENWLYGEGEDGSFDHYLNKHETLKSLSHSFVSRKQEYQDCFDVVKDMQNFIQTASITMDKFMAEAPNFSLISKEDMEQARKTISCKREWLDKHLLALSSANLHEKSPVSLKSLTDEKVSLIEAVTPVLQKLKQ